jgi:hypothetical protein
MYANHQIQISSSRAASFPRRRASWAFRSLPFLELAAAGFARLLQTMAFGVELPAVIAAANAVLLDLALLAAVRRYRANWLQGRAWSILKAAGAGLHFPSGPAGVRPCLRRAGPLKIACLAPLVALR